MYINKSHVFTYTQLCNHFNIIMLFTGYDITFRYVVSQQAGFIYYPDFLEGIPPGIIAW